MNLFALFTPLQSTVAIFTSSILNPRNQSKIQTLNLIGDLEGMPRSKEGGALAFTPISDK
jgi:hypothetical protein